MTETPDPPIQVVALEGGHNFREVGGYRTASGATMRRGLVWRSAALDQLSAVDCQTIKALGVKMIFDLRTEHERTAFPTPAGLAQALRTVSWNSDGAAGGARESSRPAWRDLDTAALRAEIARLYTAIAEVHAVQFGDIYRAVAEGAAPILVHCTAGKDRTGLAVAILLELLGVTRASVVWDYEQTNRHLDKSRVNLEAAAGVGGAAEWLAEIGAEGRDLLMAADRAYLIAALNSIEDRFGSVEAFAQARLGLSIATIDSMRERLLET